MKASRRQELRTNELAQTLEQVRTFLRRYGNYVTVAVVVVAVGLLVWLFQRRSASEALTEAVKQMSTLGYSTDAEALNSIEKLKQLAAETSNEGLVAQTLRLRAEMAMQRAHAAEDGTPSAEFLDLAGAAYQEVLDRFPDRPLEVGMALCGLATIEEDRFVLDGSATHKEAASRHLQRVRDDARFNGTPIQSVALERLNALDDILVPITIAAAPAKPEPAGPEPQVGPLLPEPGRRDIETRLVPASEVPQSVRDARGNLPVPNDASPSPVEEPAETVPDPVSEEPSESSTAEEPQTPAETSPEQKTSGKKDEPGT